MEKNYQEYVFTQEEKLEVEPNLLANMHQFLQMMADQEGVGTYSFTEPRFDYVHNETGALAPKGTKEEKLIQEYTRTFSPDRTFNASPITGLTTVGKNCLFLMEGIMKAKAYNIDLGKGHIPVEPVPVQKLEASEEE